MPRIQTSLSPFRFIASRSPLPGEKLSAWGRGWIFTTLWSCSIFFTLYRRNNRLLHKSMVQRHFWGKYSFQRAPNQVRKLLKFQELGGYDKHPLERKFQGGGGCKIKVPSVGEEWDIFWNYTIYRTESEILADKAFTSVMLTGCFIMLFEQLLKALSWM